jgi:hypothetical protein
LVVLDLLDGVLGRVNFLITGQRHAKNNSIGQGRANGMDPSPDSGHPVQPMRSVSAAVSTASHVAALYCRLTIDKHSTCTFAPPNIHQLMSQFERDAVEKYLSGSPKIDDLISLSRINVLRAAYENVIALGMTAEWLCADEAVSVFSQSCPGAREIDIPQSLSPTSLQRRVPHHPWLDVFPFPQMRDNMIMAGDALDDDELCHDLVCFWDTRDSRATLLVWGAPWDPRNWEVTEAFARKWSWVLSGCPDLLLGTNMWRRKRGEKPLLWREILGPRRA